MSLTLFETVIGGLIVLLIAWVGKRVASAISDISKQNMFTICFVNHDPPGSSEISLWDYHPIPLGHSQHWIKITTKDGFSLSDFNVRLVSDHEAAKNPDKGTPEDIRSIIQITELNVTPEIISQGVRYIQTDDRHGGKDGKFTPPYPWGKGRAIFLRIHVMANEIWSGKISFRGYDKDNSPRYARADVRTSVDSKV